MSKIIVEVFVEKSPYELMAKLAEMVSLVKKSGGITLGALPAEISALVAELPALISDCGSLMGDLAEDKVAFSKGLALGAELVVEAVLAK